MAYTTIENFKYGLDSRRSEFTSQPGSLTELSNGHVNQGGEVDKRKAFVPYGSMELILDTLGNKGTYGLQDVIIANTPLVNVFGTALPFGTVFNPFAEPVLTADMPAGVVYNQLRHPAVAAGTLFDVTKHQMVEVLCSTAFNGLSWVSVLFSDGLVFCYYNQQPIRSSYAGLVLDGQTSNNQIANSIAAAFQAFLGDTFDVQVLANVVTLTSPDGDQATFNISKTSAGGTLTGATVADSVSGKPGKSALAEFTLIAGGGGSVDSILVPDPAGLPSNTVELLAGGPVAYSLSLSTTARNVMLAINATNVGGYSATVSTTNQATVQIIAPSTAGAQVNSLDIRVSFTGPLDIGSGNTTMTVSLSKTSMIGAKQVPVAGATVYAGMSNLHPTQQDSCVASVSAGKAPYKYTWIKIFGDDAISVTNSSSPSVKFYAKVLPGQTFVATYLCTVSDAGTPQQTAGANVGITISGLNGPV